MNLQEILFLTGQAMTEYDGYTCYVEETDGDDNRYDLAVCKEGMPPHYTKQALTWDQLQAEVATIHACTNAVWTPDTNDA